MEKCFCAPLSFVFEQQPIVLEMERNSITYRQQPLPILTEELSFPGECEICAQKLIVRKQFMRENSA
jgi:hypothetical protein